MSESVACAHTAVKCLALIAAQRGIDVSADQLTREFVLGNAEPPQSLLLRMACEIGLRADRATLTWHDLTRLGDAFPVIVMLRNGNAMIATGFTLDGAVPGLLLRDPLASEDCPLVVDELRLNQAWDGTVILLKRHFKLTDVEQPFGLRWFLPEIWRQRHLFRDVGIAALMLSVLTIAMPVFFQLIIDKVVVHKSYGTLYVLAVGLFIAIAFQVVFTYLRSYITLTATNKIDAITNVRVFNKLVSLPITFFEKSSAGLILKNVHQAGSIRNFLTGQIFFTLLDAVTLTFTIPILFYYHSGLALMILGLTALICLALTVFVPILKNQLQGFYDIDARRESFLVETIQGIRTVKSLALDARQRQEWDGRMAMSINKQFELAKMVLGMQSVVMLLQFSISVVVIGFGAFFVLEGSMTVGALIAINILTGRIVAPLVQMSQLLQSFQQVAVSMRMLATIMNHPVEEGRTGRGLRTPFKGQVEFHNVRFRYPGAAAPALDRVSFTIPVGTIFGVMGRSGSGKTTVTRLLQGLHLSQEGLIKIDGHDLREIDLDHLRSSIGVVLQDSFLFRGTIRENIAIGKSNATIEEVTRAAAMAGATEFIEKLPQGFDTPLEEGSANLSGGQRQRLAIARALLIDPPILILDEATSALDAESEAIIQANLMGIARGRTLIVISHRLSSLVPAHQILCLDEGRVEDIGSHHELLERCAVYQYLWNQQTGHITAGPARPAAADGALVAVEA